MGKTAVFVITTLQQVEPIDGQVKNLQKEIFDKEFNLILGLDNCSLSYK